ncbi:MAG: hypothetical protein M3680_09170 [Myxococcota bacterium]|nr:hypothetical protein [Myxococcota bacterium]
MKRLALSAVVVLGSLVATATADRPAEPTPPPPSPQVGPQASGVGLPAVGESLAVNGAPGWPAKLAWLYDIPSFTDATGKVTVFWFCAPKIPACVDDLARIVTLKENTNRVYIVAYINGTKGQAKKLDPIRESEGVGRGTLAYGTQVRKIFKSLGIIGPASIVVDVEGKVALVSTGSSPAELDARDAKINALVGAIKEYTTTNAGPKLVKPNDKFTMAITIKLAPWLRYSKATPMEFKVMAPKDLKCNATVLRAEQLKIVERTLTAQVECSGPRGVYEARGQLTFGYEAIAGGAGLGTESANWKFEIRP